MGERTLPSLMLIDSSADERRLIAATASRAGWMVVSAADQETAVGLLQGPHGREVKTAIVGGWTDSDGPKLIAALREVSPALPVIVLSDKESVATAAAAVRAGASDFLVRPGCARADPRRACRPCRPPPRQRRARANVGKACADTRARGDGRRRSRIPKRARGCRQGGAASPADPHHRRARHRQGNARPRNPRTPACAPRARWSRSTANRSPPTPSTASCSAMPRAPSRAPFRPATASWSRPMAAP